MHAGTVVAERFVIEHAVSAGGMGTVHRAHDSHTGSTVALKVLHGHSEASIERFLREVNALALLAHPAIVRYIAHGVTDDGKLFVTLQWLEGEDLAARLKRGPLGHDETLALLWRLCDALEAAHGQGVLHRDIKPGNVFLCDGDVRKAMLLDFGIARSIHDTSTLTGELAIGTLGYMAPEQARARRDIDARADLFSLGCVAYECLTGRRAFEGTDALSLLTRLVFEESPRPRAIDVKIPLGVDELVSGLLAKDASDRPASAAAVKVALSSLSVATTDGSSARVVAAYEQLTDAELMVVSVVLADGRARDERSWRHLELERASYGGAPIEQLADGTWVATFAPAAGRTRDACLVAARCALSMRAALDGGRMVLATGKGVVGCRLPFGEVIDRAAELMRVAPRGRLIVDEQSAHRLAARFAIGMRGGFACLEAELGDTVEDFAVAHRTPFVARLRELDALASSYDECVAERMARGVMITGPAGIGKSRLAFEALARFRACGTLGHVWLSRCDPMLSASPYGTLGRVLRGAAGIIEAEPIERRRQKLGAMIERHASQAIPDDLVELLGEMAAVPFPDADNPRLRAARHDASAHAEAMRWAWQRWVELAAKRQPIVIVIEDLHWGDAPSIALLDATLRLACAVLVVALARPEVQERFPRLWREAAVQELRLGPLSARAAADLVRELIGAADEERIAAVVARSDGNALYLEELARAAPSSSLPDSVLGAVQERFLALPSDARRVLRAASVLGQEVPWSALAVLLPDMTPMMLASRLQQLSEHAFVEHGPHSTLIFRHVLLREAAYAMLPDGDREKAHRIVAEWLEQTDADAAMLADHFERGRLHARAAHHYARAAERALGALDLDTAEALAERSLRLGLDKDARAAVLLIEGEVALWRGRFDDAEARGFEALESATTGSVSWQKATAGVLYLAGQRGEMERVHAVIDALQRQPPHGGPFERAAWAQALWCFVTSGRAAEARPFLEQIETASASNEDALSEAWSWWARLYWALFASGDAEQAVVSAERAADAFERAGMLTSAHNARAHLGWALAEVGELDQAEAILTEAHELARRAGVHFQVYFTAWLLADVVLRRGNRQHALELASTALEGCQALGLRRLEGLCRTVVASVHELEGALEDALREGRRAAELLHSAPPLSAPALALLARVASRA